MLQLLISAIGILLTIFFVVGIHEYGHFLAARLVGVKVLQFSIGFGKALLRWHDKKGTEYRLALIPLGGYVKMLDETEGEVSKEELPFAYNTQPFYKKFIIVIAGPLFNILFAFAIYWLIFTIGFTSVIPLIGKVTPDSIAAKAGLEAKQEILQIDNHPTHNWASISINLLVHAGNKDKLQIETKNLQSQHIKHHTLDLTQWHMNDLRPDPLSSLGILPYDPEVPAIIGKIFPDSTAKSILKIGDKVLAINNKPVKDWFDLLQIVDKNPEKDLAFSIQRNGKKSTVHIQTRYQRDYLFHKHGIIGIAPDFKWPDNLLKQNKYNPIEALSYAWHNTVDFCNLNILILGKLLTGKISIQSLGGPITIFESAGTALNQGITPFLSFLAFLSISIGLINVLPIPGLDGGHVLIQLIELAIRRPLSPRVQELFFRLGFIILLLLITQALVNDIQRL